MIETAALSHFPRPNGEDGLGGRFISTPGGRERAGRLLFEASRVGVAGDDARAAVAARAMITGHPVAAIARALHLVDDEWVETRKRLDNDAALVAAQRARWADIRERARKLGYVDVEP